MSDVTIRPPFVSVCLIALIVVTAILVPTSLRAQEAQTPAIIKTNQLESFLGDQSHLVIQSHSGNHAFAIELADNDETRAKGLMYRTNMGPNTGMLFDFGRLQPIYMWMKNTYVSLDMLFVLEDGTIHHLVKATTPLSQSIIGSGGSVRYVLEVKKGTVDRTGVKPGDKLLHQLFTPK